VVRQRARPRRWVQPVVDRRLGRMDSLPAVASAGVTAHVPTAAARVHSVPNPPNTNTHTTPPLFPLDYTGWFPAEYVDLLDDVSEEESTEYVYAWQPHHIPFTHPSSAPLPLRGRGHATVTISGESCKPLLCFWNNRRDIAAQICCEERRRGGEGKTSEQAPKDYRRNDQHGGVLCGKLGAGHPWVRRHSHSHNHSHTACMHTHTRAVHTNRHRHEFLYD